MSQVAQYQQWLSQVIQQKLQETLNDPTVSIYANIIGQNLQQIVNQNIWNILTMLYDTNLHPLTAADTPNMIHRYIRAATAQELMSRQVQPPYPLQQDLQYITSILNDAKMRLQPPAPPPLPSNPGMGMGLAGAYNQGYPSYGNPAPPPNLHNKPIIATGAFKAGPVGNSNDNLMPMNNRDGIHHFISEPEGTPMNKDQHIPAHMKTDIYSIQTEPAPKINSDKPIAPVYEPSNDFTRIKVKDFTEGKAEKEECFDISVGCSLFMMNKETLSMPSIFYLDECKWIPTFNSNEDLRVEISELPSSESIDDFFNSLDSISKRYSIPGFLAWIDQRISILVEKTLRYRFGMETITIPNYRVEYRDIDNYLEKKGIRDDVHCIIKHWLESTFSSVRIMTVAEHEGVKEVKIRAHISYLEVIQECYFVTLPWVIDFNYKTQTPVINGVSTNQLFAIFDDCWKIMDNNDIMSVVVLDISNNRYRVYRKGNMKFNPSEYHFEWLGF